MPETKTGRTGERAAAAYLKKRGYRIVECNYRTRFGEIDVIAQSARFLVFLEVKTRKEGSLSHPMESVTAGKRHRLRLAAEQYLLQHPSDLQPRFDAAAVFTENGRVKRIEYLENVF